jgi:hypothetical protein
LEVRFSAICFGSKANTENALVYLHRITSRLQNTGDLSPSKASLSLTPVSSLNLKNRTQDLTPAKPSPFADERARNSWIIFCLRFAPAVF